MDITALKLGLLRDVRAVVEYLLPNGVKQGQEWRVGSLSGEKGHSLAVHLQGGKAGVWSDFQSGESGDIVDLWVQIHGITLTEGLREIADWLGVVRPTMAFRPQREYVRPAKPRCRTPEARVKDYLTEIRNVPGHILDAYKVGEDGDMIVFPFLLPSGELAMAKRRKAEDKAKPVPTAPNCEPVLFGWQAVPGNVRDIVITEGEIDALSWAAYGHTAMSIPFGGGGGAKQQWIENEFERLERFERIFLATDMDKPGDEAAAEIALRLGRHRCYRVKMPLKDANACLMEGIAKAVMDAAITEAESLDPEGLKRPIDFTDDVLKLFWPVSGKPVGFEMPYVAMRDKLRFRPGEVTLWSGASGAGKSQILSDCSVDWIRQGSQICISSLEMRAPSLLKRMCRQVVGIEKPSPAAVEESLRWMSEGLLVYDMTGKASVDVLIEVFDYARAKYGCDQFIVDSLMRLGLASDDYSGQEKAVYRLVDWTVSSGIHLHVVAHARKGGAQSLAPETEDIKGAMEIGANAFNILTVWRNRDIEDATRKALEAKDEGRGKAFFEGLKKSNKHFGGKDFDELYANLLNSAGVVLNVAKQRNGDFEGKIGLFFDEKSYRYRSKGDHKDFSREKYITKDLRQSSGS